MSESDYDIGASLKEITDFLELNTIPLEYKTLACAKLSNSYIQKKAIRTSALDWINPFYEQNEIYRITVLSEKEIPKMNHFEHNYTYMILAEVSKKYDDIKNEDIDDEILKDYENTVCTAILQLRVLASIDQLHEEFMQKYIPNDKRNNDKIRELYNKLSGRVNDFKMLKMDLQRDLERCKLYN